MVFDTIAEQAIYKGLDFVGTGDILHPKWMEMLKKGLEKVDEGTYQHSEHGTKFVLTTEVEDEQKVHHLLIFPSIQKVEEFREKLEPYSSDMYIDGRPKVDLTGVEIAEFAADSDSLIGPSHAFTPWTSIFKEFESLEECYEDQLKNVDFLELGLSADTFLADRIGELGKLSFLSNSDAHSPWPNKLGREFNRFELSEPNASELFESIKKRKNITLNVGLDPELGKYHLTACSRCYKRFSLKEAEKSGWKCNKCGGTIKKGVYNRIGELSEFEKPQSPDFRPYYLHTVPLTEIIALAWNFSNPRSSQVQKTWRSLVEEFDNEITVLVDTPIDEIENFTDSEIAFMIQAFRNKELDIVPGGGGKYGELERPAKVINAQKKETQKKLSEFG
ncbi:hypothetical protein AKJ37_03825 [candidate division MSBL1 archaeon SCGC-AAA259I09]|uniref:Phosphotransferase n=2 Tax=candidate division MSBL1 TaxID=215777 RepID=A0A133USF5_9EURY|nr:hypothetical protein AKJ37_03825 [candidate division MSBL1 archaeon SCGC-AAA259I09]KXB00812.1 hypothetical protein AKJ40_00425 [candidate division MSBL1 archaeon SCGC-AAA259M10]